MNSSRNIIIAGNGPSLTKIDYSRMPEEYEVARLNNFFFEDKYYLGKRVDYYLTDATILDGEYLNLYKLQEKKEYDIGKILVSNANESTLKTYPGVVDAFEMFFSFPNQHFHKFWFVYSHYYAQYLSGGTFLIFLAYIMGYRNIYLIGFDLYKDTLKLYPWETSPPEFAKRHPIHVEKNVMNIINKSHPQDMQLKAIELLKKHTDINLYSISSESSINDHVALAPVKNKESKFKILDKSSDRLKDWVPVPSIYSEKREKKKNLFFQQIFSVQNENNHKVIRILGIKISLKKK